jgi:hypothetical protein
VKLVRDPAYGEVDLTASAEELDRLASAVSDGDETARAALADNLRAMAAAEDGGHLHIDYFPNHPYLVEGSMSLVVNSPHGGMPTR